VPNPIDTRQSWRMEQFSQAYVKAVAAAAGCTVSWDNCDIYGTDGTLSMQGGDERPRMAKLDFQLKATSQKLRTNGIVRFPLKRHNYDELITMNLIVPRVLILVLVPHDIDQWANYGEDRLLLRHCGYWVSLRGRPTTNNEHTVSIQLTSEKPFSPDGLATLMTQISHGEIP